MTLAELEKRVARLEELEKKVKVLDDIEDIKKLHYQYVYWLEHHQYDEIVACFTEDATAEFWRTGVHKGTREIERLYKDKHGYAADPRIPHFVGQGIITVDGDKAKGHFQLIALHPEPCIQWMTGVHDCEYVKVNGKWKFSKLLFAREYASHSSML
jgi:hypothetical protein